MRNITFPNKPNYKYHAIVNWVKRNLSDSEQIPRSTVLEIVSKFKIGEFTNAAERAEICAQREEALIGKYLEHMKNHPLEERFYSEIKAMADTLDEHFDGLIARAENSSQVLAGLTSIYTVDTLHEYVQGIQSDKAAELSERDEFIKDACGFMVHLSDAQKEAMKARFKQLFN